MVDADEGRISFRGQDISRLGHKQLRPLRREMQIIYQDPYESLDPRYRVRDTVAEPLLIHGIGGSAAERDALVVQALVQAGLQPPELYLDRFPHELSGGQRQRVAIARSLVLEPTLLLLDEPLGALDLKLREHMKIELKQLQSAFGTTFVYITHDQSEALVLSDHVGVMNRGRFEQLGTPQELYYSPATPFVAAFVGANNRIAGKALAVEGELVELQSSAGWTIKARRSGAIARGDAVEAFIRPEVAIIGRSVAELAAAPQQAVHEGEVESLLFDGANSAVLLQEAKTRFEFRIALPQTGRYADLKVGERVVFTFDPMRAVCFAADGPHA
jgi:spermidine/putrescine transport system ATP-binding protein